jgi:hypothetical protein
MEPPTWLLRSDLERQGPAVVENLSPDIAAPVARFTRLCPSDLAGPVVASQVAGLQQSGE